MESFRQLLRGHLGHSLKTLPALDRLTAAWPVACGSVLAKRGSVAAFEKGILTIVVADPAWMDQLFAMRSMLQQELSRIAEVPLAGIHFQRAGSRRDEG